MKYKLAKTIQGKKIHLCYPGGHWNQYKLFKCGCHIHQPDVYTIKYGLIFKSMLCDNCFKGMSPENFDIEGYTFKR